MAEPTGNIQALVDPDSYAEALRNARVSLVRKLATQLVEKRLLEDSPVWKEEEKELSVLGVDRLLRDLEWRIGEIDAALRAFNEVKEVVALPAAERAKRLEEIRKEQEAEGRGSTSTSKEG